jgi:hypothetical protein
VPSGRGGVPDCASAGEASTNDAQSAVERVIAVKDRNGARLGGTDV